MANTLTPLDETDRGEPAPAPRRARRLTPARRRALIAVLTAVLYSAIWAVLCDLVLEFSVWRHAGGMPFHAMFTYTYGWLIGSAVLWVLLLGLIALTNRYWLSLGLFLAAAVVVSAVNDVKMAVRSEPVYPSDLDFVSQPRFLLQMVPLSRVLLLVLVMVAVVLGCAWLGRRFGRIYPRVRRAEHPLRWRWLLGLRAVGVALALATLVSAAHFNSPGGSMVREVYESKDSEWRFWYQALNYHDNGFVGGFLYNLPTEAMSKPAGYDQAAMDALVARYSALARTHNRGLDPATLADTNVVLVLSEAFSDPTGLKGFTLGEDPIPFTRQTMSETTSGSMLAQLYGGGTANMEFEALTGQSLALFRPQMNTPYQQLVGRFSSYPSAVSWLAASGHRPVAVHPYFTGMYKRKQVYDVLGFDEFVHDTTMQQDDKLGRSKFISDASAFHEVTHQIESNDQPLLVNLVTMQNHVPVHDEYDDPFEVDGDLPEKSDIGQYARGLSHTDEALEEFLGTLQKSDEPTVVVFYGDHQPGIYGSKVTGANGEIAMRTTPYFVWSNTGGPQEQHGLTSPTHFLPMAMDQIGAPIPPMYALLDALQAQIPAMEQGKFVTADGDVVEEPDLSPQAQQVLHDMRLVQYDLSIGKRYAAQGLWATP